MAEAIGKRITCDRCGKSIFLAFVGVKAFDGGYTRHNEFEPAPDDWHYSSELQMRLCDTCYATFKELLNEFKNGDVP